MELLNVSKSVYEEYRQKVSGAENISLNQLRRKLTRNMLLAQIKTSHKKDRTYYMYGRFHFIVNKYNTVVWMSNRMGVPSNWKRDNKRLIELNKQLGIKSDVTELSLVVRDNYLSQIKNVNGIRWKIGENTVLG